MQRIPLEKANEIVGYALVDDEEIERVRDYRWYLDDTNKKYGNKLYARTYIFDDELKRKGRKSPYRCVRMHQLIMGTAGKGRNVHVDHINHDGLDNRKENLRILSGKENINRWYRGRPIGRGPYKATFIPKSGYKNVHKTRSGRYKAVLHYTNIGVFDTPEEAYAEVQEARKRIMRGGPLRVQPKRASEKRSKYYGLTYKGDFTPNAPWAILLRVGKATKSFGSYALEEEAARWVDKIILYHGLDRSKMNFPISDYDLEKDVCLPPKAKKASPYRGVTVNKGCKGLPQHTNPWCASVMYKGNDHCWYAKTEKEAALLRHRWILDNIPVGEQKRYFCDLLLAE